MKQSFQLCLMWSIFLLNLPKNLSSRKSKKVRRHVTSLKRKKIMLGILHESKKLFIYFLGKITG